MDHPMDTVQQHADEWIAEIQQGIAERGSTTPRKDMLEFVLRKLAEATLKVADTLKENKEEIPEVIDTGVHHGIDMLVIAMQYAHDRLWNDR